MPVVNEQTYLAKARVKHVILRQKFNSHRSVVVAEIYPQDLTAIPSKRKVSKTASPSPSPLRKQD